jgi:hypothetical protein
LVHKGIFTPSFGFALHVPWFPGSYSSLDQKALLP